MSAAEVGLEELKRRIEYKLNEHLIEMKPDYDDSITGFNEAWDIVKKAFDRASLASDAKPAGDPICRNCASQEPGSYVPEECTCGQYPAEAKPVAGEPDIDIVKRIAAMIKYRAVGEHRSVLIEQFRSLLAEASTVILQLYESIKSLRRDLDNTKERVHYAEGVASTNIDRAETAERELSSERARTALSRNEDRLIRAMRIGNFHQASTIFDIMKAERIDEDHAKAAE